MKVSRAIRLARSDPSAFVRRAREEAATETARIVRTARRRTGATVRAAAMRTGLPRVAARGPAADVDYCAVLDGHTLNLRATVPGGLTGRAEVVFTRRGEQVRAPAEPAGGRIVATVPLGAAVGGAPLTAGVWRMELAVTAGGAERRFALRGEPREPVDADGPTVARPPCPRTGVRYDPQQSPSGRYRLRVFAAEPCAEVTRVRITPGRVEITGRLVGLAPAAVVLRFRSRAGGPRPHVPALMDGPVFRAVVPVEALAGGTADAANTADRTPAAAGRVAPAGDAERIWDVVADVAGHGTLRVGRRLHDVRDPRRGLRIPQRAIAPRPGVLVRVRPYYTGAGDLVLACAPIGVSQ